MPGVNLESVLLSHSLSTREVLMSMFIIALISDLFPIYVQNLWDNSSFMVSICSLIRIGQIHFMAYSGWKSGIEEKWSTLEGFFHFISSIYLFWHQLSVTRSYGSMCCVCLIWINTLHQAAYGAVTALRPDLTTKQQFHLVCDIVRLGLEWSIKSHLTEISQCVCKPYGPLKPGFVAVLVRWGVMRVGE